MTEPAGLSGWLARRAPVWRAGLLLCIVVAMTAVTVWLVPFITTPALLVCPTAWGVTLYLLGDRRFGDPIGSIFAPVAALACIWAASQSRSLGSAEFVLPASVALTALVTLWIGVIARQPLVIGANAWLLGRPAASALDADEAA